ncbi:hypothetical protein [Aeoliella sp.]|uniref:hypothetical protein n=1 Tax=Aeoliella sp. TaxID=2795800 RepID=UPI003CCBB729
MALITCKDCKKEFSTDAKRCPQCGAKKPGSRIVKYGLYLIIFVFVIVPWIGSMAAKKPKQPATSANVATTTDMADAIQRAKKVLNDPNADNFSRTTAIVDLEAAKSNTEPSKKAEIEEILAAVRKQAAKDEPKPEGAWRLERSRSPLDDSETVILYLNANEPIQAWLKSSVPTLFIRCKENKTEIYIRTETAANTEYGKYNSATVRLRLDKNPAFKQTWSESTDKEALFAPGSIALAKKLAKAETLTFEFTPFTSFKVS